MTFRNSYLVIKSSRYATAFGVEYSFFAVYPINMVPLRGTPVNTCGK